MPWTGSLGSRTFSRLTGFFTGSTAWVQTDATGRGIVSTDHDTHDSDLATGIGQCLTHDGSNKPTANIDWGGFRITTLGTPSTSTDAANKQYVDDTAATIVNFTVRLASTANVNLTSDVDAGSTFDGTALVEADRILLKNQTAPAENGIYVVPAALGTAARATDMDTWAETLGALVNVTAGSTNAGTSWRSTSNSGGTIDTTALSFVAHGTNVTLPLAITSGGTGQITAALSFAALKQDASSTATGVVELATAGELRTGTDTARVAPVSILWDAMAEVALTPGTSVAVDMATGINFSLAIAQNATLSNPTNVKAGQSGRIRITQDGSGNRTLAYGSNWEFVGGSAPTLSTTAADQDVLYYDCISSTRILAWLARDIS